MTAVRFFPARRRLAFEAARRYLGQTILDCAAVVIGFFGPAALMFIGWGHPNIAAPYAFFTGMSAVAFVLGVKLRNSADVKLDAEIERAVAAALADGEDNALLAEAA